MVLLPFQGGERGEATYFRRRGGGTPTQRPHNARARTRVGSKVGKVLGKVSAETNPNEVAPGDVERVQQGGKGGAPVVHVVDGRRLDRHRPHRLRRKKHQLRKRERESAVQSSTKIR